MEFKYEIGDRVFYQRPLVLGQVKQLISILKGFAVPYELTAQGLVFALGGQITEAMAIGFVEENIQLKDKNVEEVVEFLDNNITIEQTLKVVSDFFDCNPIVSISETMIGLTNKVKKNMTQAISLTESVLSSQEEISPKEIVSSGGTPSETVSPT